MTIREFLISYVVPNVNMNCELSINDTTYFFYYINYQHNDEQTLIKSAKNLEFYLTNKKGNGRYKELEILLYEPQYNDDNFLSLERDFEEYFSDNWNDSLYNDFQILIRNNKIDNFLS